MDLGVIVLLNARRATRGICVVVVVIGMSQVRSSIFSIRLIWFGMV